MAKSGPRDSASDKGAANMIGVAALPGDGVEAVIVAKSKGLARVPGLVDAAVENAGQPAFKKAGQPSNGTYMHPLKYQLSGVLRVGRENTVVTCEA